MKAQPSSSDAQNAATPSGSTPSDCFLPSKSSETVFPSIIFVQIVEKEENIWRLHGHLLPDLIKTKHNSNHKTRQTTLKGEIIQEYNYYVLGFVPVDVVRLKKCDWVMKLSHEQIANVSYIVAQKNFAPKKKRWVQLSASGWRGNLSLRRARATTN